LVEEEIECGDVIPNCADGLDNDGDSLIDLADDDCSSWYDYEIPEVVEEEEQEEVIGDEVEGDTEGETGGVEEGTSTETGTEAQEAEEIVECNKNGDCSSGVCIDNSCVTCTDSDGVDYEVQGSASGYIESLGRESSIIEACARGGNLNEYYCSSGYLVFDTIDCQDEGYTSCSEGACIVVSDETISEEAQALMEESEAVLDQGLLVDLSGDECTNDEWIVEEECFEDTDCGAGAIHNCVNNVCDNDKLCTEYGGQNACEHFDHCYWVEVASQPGFCMASDDDEDGYYGDVNDCFNNDASINSGVTENCADGLDDDCDGFTDCADPDCSSDSACSSYSCSVSICNNHLDCADQGDNNYCNEEGCCVNLCGEDMQVLEQAVVLVAEEETEDEGCKSDDDCSGLRVCDTTSGECVIQAASSRGLGGPRFGAAETDEGIFSRFWSWLGGLFS